jgi:Leucine-rich repeat (LRR) protein
VDEQVSFDDHALEEAIRHNLKVPVGPIALTQMQEITGLDLVNHPEVQKISVLRHCKHLTILSLEGTKVSDLSPLSGLRELETLSVNRTPVAHLAPLENMSKLRRLYVGKTYVTNISPLASLTGLRYISLAYSPVSDIQPLIDLCVSGGLRKGEVMLWGTPLSWQARMVQVSMLASLDVEVHV